MKEKVVNLENKKIDEVNINESIFCNKIFPDIINSYIKYQLSNKRSGNHKTKNRSEVKGRAKKPFSQKGTGNARQGGTKAPHFRGGAISFGPVVRDHSIKLNKKEKKLALKCALSEKYKNNEIIILKNFELDSHKTKELIKKINKFEVKSAIFIKNKDELAKNFAIASSNIPKINTIDVEGLNVKDMLNHEKLFISVKAVDKIQEKLQ